MYNKLIMIGNLTRDIELKYLPNGNTIASGAIATSHKYKLPSGEQKEEVCFMDFSVFGKQATILSQYVRKGSKVMLEGRVKLEQWADKQTGTNRSKHSLLVSEFKFLDSKADSEALGGQNQPMIQHQQQPSYDNSNNMSQQPYNNQEQSYQAPQYGQQQPMQNNYNNAPEQNYGQQQSGMQNHQIQQQQQQPDVYEEKIPTIDIDNDEIPF